MVSSGAAEGVPRADASGYAASHRIPIRLHHGTLPSIGRTCGVLSLAPHASTLADVVHLSCDHLSTDMGTVRACRHTSRKDDRQ